MKVGTVKRLLAIAAATMLGLLVGAAQAAAPPNRYVHVGVNEAKQAEVAKKVPITKKRGQREQSVASLESGDLGPIKAGQTIRGQGEVEVSVTCTESMPQCVGKIYKFSPHVEAQFVLADSPTSSHGERLGKPIKRTCSQDYPNRNHHCVLVLDRTDVARRSCSDCSLNIVLTAWDDKAQSNNVLVIGGDSDHGIEQGRASISAAVFRSSAAKKVTRTYHSTTPLVKSAEVVDSSSDSQETALGSVRIDDLQQGEALIVTATAHTNIGELGYNVLTQGEVVVSEKGPNSTDNSGTPVRAVSKNGKISVQNGFNCTQGASDYRNPCEIHKVGAAYMVNPAVSEPNHGQGHEVPLYVNLIGSFGAEYGKPFHQGDRVKVRSVDVRVQRIPAG